jgi:hypothetical protein
MRPKPKHSLGPDVIAFVEGLMVHGPGDVLGKPVNLTAEEKRFLLWAYEVDGNGPSDRAAGGAGACQGVVARLSLRRGLRWRRWPVR